ncbi:hypothetical protein DFH09DRAFT_1319710 [Mycena vulgaris]|nr:hypothetical protein DFH09DRAFT_1319710 [Mycena vulgaris]
MATSRYYDRPKSPGEIAMARHDMDLNTLLSLQPPTPRSVDPQLAGLLTMFNRLDVLRGMHGGTATPVIELLRAKAAAQTGAAGGSAAPQDSLLTQVLALDPALLAHHGLTASRPASTPKPRGYVWDTYDNTYYNERRQQSPVPVQFRRKLHTSPVDTNGGRAICPSELDPTIPQADLHTPVWVSAFSDGSPPSKKKKKRARAAAHPDSDDEFEDSPEHGALGAPFSHVPSPSSRRF